MATLRRDPASAWRHVDVTLLGCVAAVALLGALMVFSATRGAEAPHDYSFLQKQIVYLVLGAGVLAAAAVFDYRKLLDFGMFVYGGTVVLLLFVLTPLGESVKGTQGWYQLGPFQLQPSEFAKLGLVAGLAFLAAHFQGDVDHRRLGAMLGMAAVPIGLVMLQPDLGTAMVLTAITVAMLVVAGARPRHLAAMALIALLGVFAVLQVGLLDDYQRDRLGTFLDQNDEVLNTDESREAAYNLNQSKIAIGSGGWLGKGLFQGTQTRLGAVPEQHTDFIFTAVGEELGLLGAGTLLALLSIVVWRTWRTSQLSRDTFGSLLCAGILAMFVFQIFENVGMTMGIMPITGIPLPFMSYGGSSILVACLAIGLVLNVHSRRFN